MFQVKPGMTEKQYFDFTLKSGSKENWINKNVWYGYMWDLDHPHVRAKVMVHKP